MFERRGDPAQLTDEALISAVTAATQAEACQSAWRLALVAEVTARHCADEDDEIAHQVIDGWAFAQAQVGAACNLNPYAASKQMRIAMALRDRLPRTAAVFATGAVSATVIDAITWRTHLVTDPDALALIDTAIAGEAADYGTRSEKNLIEAVDLWVEKFDPIAVVRSKRNAKDLYVSFDDKDDPNGVSSFWGRLRVTDKKILKQRLDDLADTVCSNDPRARGELHAAALGALGVVGPELERLTCECGTPDCPGSGKDPRSAAVTIYMLAEQVAATKSEPKPVSECRKPTVSPGVLLGGGIIPADMLADLIATGAKVRPLARVADLPTERQYRPSVALTAFVRMRFMTCSFPGCSRPAHRCDLDHLTPWPAGATHPGNLHPLCREHHLIKTFRTGPGGFTATLKSDGTIEWTAPTGHLYNKASGASIMFPHWSFETSIPRERSITLIGDDGRDNKMPTRDRTRTQDREQRINAERAANALALERDPPPY